ncbi:MAG: DDE-type integrase/transposase/recombinase [Chloroflexi bacterium]|nr:DDE-type integrase/transposase/recombinase [Chloroflexota bacterium]
MSARADPWPTWLRNSTSRASAPHRWIARYRSEETSGLHDRPSRPRRSPTRTAVDVEAQVLQSRREQSRGPDWIAAELGIPARTVGAILKRHHVPHLADCDPLTGELIRATRLTRCRYERERPGELVHMDVKKLGRIPSGGGWRARGGTPGQHASRLDKTPIGYDYIHSLIDDHFRFAYSEVHADEQGTTCAAFLLRSHPFRDPRDRSHRAPHDSGHAGGSEHLDRDPSDQHQGGDTI